VVGNDSARLLRDANSLLSTALSVTDLFKNVGGIRDAHRLLINHGDMLAPETLNFARLQFLSNFQSTVGLINQVRNSPNEVSRILEILSQKVPRNTPVVPESLETGVQLLVIPKK